MGEKAEGVTHDLPHDGVAVRVEQPGELPVVCGLEHHEIGRGLEVILIIISHA
jgi:hypothetical protein